MKKQEKLLLFDCDGVIVDSFKIVYENVQRFITENGGPAIDIDQYRDFFEQNPLEAIFSLIGVKPNGSTISKEQMQDFFHQYEQTSIVQGMKELLEELSTKHTLVIITSTITDFITAKFDEEGISDLFVAYLGPRSAIKKDEKILLAMDEFGFAKENTIFISDTSGDIREAKKTGVKTIGVTWGYHDEQRMEKAEPDQLVNSPSKLKEKIYE